MSKRIETELDRLLERNEFRLREQAIEALLADGLSVYDPSDGSSSEMTENVFTRVVDDQLDPTLEDDRCLRVPHEDHRMAIEA